jgi:trigger factor
MTEMQVTAEQTDPCTLVLDVSIDEQQVARAFDAAYKELSKFASVPGFRPGKAPRAIVERYLDPQRVRQHTMEKLIRATYPDAIEEQGVVPFRSPVFDPSDLEDKKPFSYKASVPLEPRVTLGEYMGLTVNKPVFPVTDVMIDAQIEAVRNERAKFERVTDRGIEAGDMAIADIQTIVDGDESPEPARRRLVQLGSNIPGYDEALMGAEVGEERTFDLVYPEDYEDENLRGKPVKFVVKVSSISARKLPELNEDLFKEVAGVDTEEEFRARVAESIKSNAERTSNELAEQALIEKILETSEVYFPSVLVRDEVEEKYRRLSVELRQNGLSYAAYLAQTGQTEEQHQSNVIAEAQMQIQVLLALREIARTENLQASEEAIDAEFARLQEIGAITPEQFEDYVSDPRRRMQVANALIQQSLHDFLFANNTLVEVERTFEEIEAEAASAEAAAEAEEAEGDADSSEETAEPAEASAE